MELIIGLGNPGGKYQNNRHNIGFMVIDELQKIPLPKGVVLQKSNVFMNESGIFVGKLVAQFKLDLHDLYIIHDDLDIPLGSFKIQFGKGPKVHNGLMSIDEALGTDKYWHVKMGVDNRPVDDRTVGEEYVLQDFTEEERAILDKTIKELVKKLTNIQ